MNESISLFKNGDFETRISKPRQFRKFGKDGNFEINFKNGDFENLSVLYGFLPCGRGELELGTCLFPAQARPIFD